MKYLPFENITYKTKLDSDVVLKRISEVVEPNKTFRMTFIGGNTNQKQYEGNISGLTFNMTRIIGYRNSFLPKIKGVIEKDFYGTIVHVKMRLSVFVVLFMFIWFGGVGVGCLAAIASIASSDNFEPMLLMPFVMLIFGYILVTGGFKYESVKSKKFLAQLFEAEFEK